MKKLILGLIVATLTLNSCTNDEIINVPNDTNNSLLESFQIKRNIDGSYALTHEIKEGVAVDYSQTKNGNEVYLYQGVSSKSNNKNYKVTDNELNVSFVDENNSKLPRISITDDNTNQSDKLSLLETYSVDYNKDGSVQVDFKVKKGVAVAFSSNEDNINNIYLTEGSSSTVDYSKTYVKIADSSLQIDFVQTTGKSTETKKPRLIVD
jgi:hypothetical protein